MKSSPYNYKLVLSLVTAAALIACADDSTTPATASATSGTGDGDPGDGDPGDGDPGDGDGDPGDGDGDPGDGDGDGDPMPGTCDDGIMNQDESDVDCGGSNCEPCELGEMCNEAMDCNSAMCDGVCVECVSVDDCAPVDDTCTEAACNAGTCEVVAANEAGPCDNEVTCMDNGTCQDGVCVETDTDCTMLDSDCEQGMCDFNTGSCYPMAINDMGACDNDEACMDNGICDAGTCVESPTDCTMLDSDCLAGSCDVNTDQCEAIPANDNGFCDNNEVCMDSGTCQAGACVESPTDCTSFDTDCTMGFCDMNTDQCDSNAVNEDQPCMAGLSCGADPVCQMGQCTPIGPNDSLFYENFANNSQGWTLDTDWEIGATFAGCGDPADDHSPTNDNGVAAVVLGGCAPTNIHAYYCLTSPVIDTSGEQTVWMTYYRHLWSDYTPYMKNILEVYDGNAWQTLFETFGSPGVDDQDWTYFGYDVSAHANANMQFRWCFNIDSNGVFNRGSWTVDDVTVATSECNGAD